MLMCPCDDGLSSHLQWNDPIRQRRLAVLVARHLAGRLEIDIAVLDDGSRAHLEVGLLLGGLQVVIDATLLFIDRDPYHFVILARIREMLLKVRRLPDAQGERVVSGSAWAPVISRV